MATRAMDGIEAAARIARARASVASDHRTMLLELNAIFRAGQPPLAPLDGPYSGQLVTTTFGRACDALTGAIGQVYPFDPAVCDERTGLVRAYPFRTYMERGTVDRDRDVFKIDYDIPANPFGLIRRVLDEVVEVAPGYFLGKAHLRLGARWRTVAYFALQSEAP